MEYFVVDAFTDVPFTGNPAAVVLLDTADPSGAAPETSVLQRIAAETNLPATAFLAGGQPDASLRWFSAAAELELCGHGTLATAHVLHETGRADGPLTFRTRGGVLRAERLPAGDIGLTLPADATEPLPSAATVAAALGVTPVTVHRGRLDLLAELDDPAAVRAVTPDLAAVRALDTRGVIVTARGGNGSDFVSRFFAPSAGIDEDPVTGSAHCTLGPYWAARLGRTSLTGHQVSTRGGRVGVDVDGGQVRLRGRAVTVAHGELLLPGR
ncbi:MAG: PhzF family phenazine biosynthesis isomerase [Streptosporangiales bacterium]|nr:PhzF family phenazine biosynthesis isomerase [Streptosporangiales bacterium]